MSRAEDLVGEYAGARARAQAAAAAERQLLGQAVEALATKGSSIRQMAARLGVPKSTVHRVLVASKRSASTTKSRPATQVAGASGAAGMVEGSPRAKPRVTKRKRTPTRPSTLASRQQRGETADDAPVRRAVGAQAKDTKDASGSRRPVRAVRRKKERWFVVETKPEHRDDLDRAVVIMSAHASEAGAIRGRARLWRRGPPEGVVYVVRHEAQIRYRLTWDSELGRGVTREGPPPPRPSR